MLLSQARELVDFCRDLVDIESACVRPARSGGYKLVVRQVGQPPRSYVNYRKAFEAYCGLCDD